MPTAEKVKYPKIEAVLRAKQEKEGPLTVPEAKEFIGWTEENGEEKWGTEYTLKDRFGKKIRLLNNPTNRPFREPLAERYCNEMLRDKWALNLETIVLDRNGHVQQGQHRLIGLILAEQDRSMQPVQFGSRALTLEVLMGFGVSPSREVADTYDRGANRSLSDVLYRHQKFGKNSSDKEQKNIATTLAGALRLVWLRMGGKQVSFAPHFPHSEAVEFFEQHKDILTAVQEILTIDKEAEGGLSTLLSPAYAAALYYLMKSTEANDRTALDFWKSFATGEGLTKGNPILSLRQSLTKNTGPRDETVGTVIKAWLAWVAGEDASVASIGIKKKKVGEKFVLAEFPQIGGLDVTPIAETKISGHQMLILNLLKKGEKTYADLSKASGLQIGQLGKAVRAETRKGNKNPDSLEALGFVESYPIEDGPATFQISKKGLEFLAAK